LQSGTGGIEPGGDVDDSLVNAGDADVVRVLDSLPDQKSALLFQGWSNLWSLLAQDRWGSFARATLELNTKAHLMRVTKTVSEMSFHSRCSECCRRREFSMTVVVKPVTTSPQHEMLSLSRNRIPSNPGVLL